MKNTTFRHLNIEIDGFERPVALLHYVGDGKYIDPHYKMRVAVTPELYSSALYGEKSEEYRELIEHLWYLNSGFVTEAILADLLEKAFPFVRVPIPSLKYDWFYHTKSWYTFDTVINTNNMIDLNKIINNLNTG